MRSLGVSTALYTPPSALLARRGGTGGDHPLSVAATFLLAYKQVETLHPLAAQILLFCTFLYIDDIPEEIIKAAFPYFNVDEPSAVASYKLDEVFLVLCRFSLIQRHVGTQSFRIHHLVQVVLRGSIGQNSLQQWIERTIQAVNAAFSAEAEAFEPAYDRYIPHVQACHHLIEQAVLKMPEAACLLAKAGSCLLKRGHSAEAKPLLTQAFALQEALYGPASPESANTLQQLAALSFTPDM